MEPGNPTIPVGVKFGLLTVIGEGPRKIRANGWSVKTVLAQCVCGAQKAFSSVDLRVRREPSCGCMGRKELPPVSEHLGKKFGRWTILGVGSTRTKALHGFSGRMVRVKCECGDERETSWNSVFKGDSKSCGCYHDDLIREIGHSNRKYSPKESRLYKIWHGIKQRCYNPNVKTFHHYGGRGITMCDRWLNSAHDFIEDSKLFPGSGNTIDRKNNDEGYSPENCRWATMKDQVRNKRNTLMVKAFGVEAPLAELAEKHSKPYQLVYARIVTYGWDAERALTEEKE